MTGKVYAGFKVHPDKEHIIYPLGNTVIIEHITKYTKSFLQGHTDNVSCVAVSKNGKYIASGQETYMGFKVGLYFDWFHSYTQGMPEQLKQKIEDLIWCQKYRTKV